MNDMDFEKQEAIFAKYPLLFDGRRDPGTPKWAIRHGIACEDGWHDIIDRLCARIVEMAEADRVGVKVHQIKEKFGHLCFYVGKDWRSLGGPDHDGITEAIAAAVREADTTCEFCGAGDAALTMKFRWIRTLCPPCTEEYPENHYRKVKARDEEFLARLQKVNDSNIEGF